MNERIKEFRFKAAEYANEQKPFDLMKWNEIRDAKFAELIVRECAELIGNKVMLTADEAYDEVLVAIYDTNFANAEMIKSHFGVDQ